MKDFLHELTLERIAEMLGRSMSEEDELLTAHLQYHEAMNFLRYPCRLDAFCAFYCVKGNFGLEINGRHFSIEENTLVIYVPGNIVRIIDYSQDIFRNLDFVIVAARRKYIAEAGFDFTKVFENSLELLSNPCIKLSAEEFDVLRKYYILGETIAALNTPDKKLAQRSLGASLFYLMGNIWSNSINMASRASKNADAKATLIFENFMRLLVEHHIKEHGVAFYAEKLCLTPKYLSQLVKRVSGRSAPEWIDSIIILEAKNLLKYSRKSIKEISYDLNFSSESAFCTYFLGKAGMRPSEFREL